MCFRYSKSVLLLFNTQNQHVESHLLRLVIICLSSEQTNLENKNYSILRKEHKFVTSNIHLQYITKKNKSKRIENWGDIANTYGCDSRRKEMTKQ